MQRLIVIQVPRAVRRRLRTRLQGTRDAHRRTQLQIVLPPHQIWCTTMIAHALQCASATSLRALRRFHTAGEAGVEDGWRANGTVKMDPGVMYAVREMVASTTEVHGWTRPTWTWELLARTVTQCTGVTASVSCQHQ